jgi:hypothetical protein
MIFEQPDIAALAARLLDTLQLATAGEVPVGVPADVAAQVAAEVPGEVPGEVFDGSDDDVLRLIADSYGKMS